MCIDYGYQPGQGSIQHFSLGSDDVIIMFSDNSEKSWDIQFYVGCGHQAWTLFTSLGKESIEHFCQVLVSSLINW